jgi:hypothetical protein
MTNGGFSDYELREMGIKVAGSEAYVSANCVGSCEEELDAKVISKSCRGVVFKKTVKGAGTGKLVISMHMPWNIYVDVYGMDLDTLIDGVMAYGINSIHKGFSCTQHVFDEDGVEKFKAYPNCIINVRPTITTENGAEEVAQVEMEIGVMPDTYGNGMYEALAEGLEQTIATSWMENFTSDLVQVKTA